MDPRGRNLCGVVSAHPSFGAHEWPFLFVHMYASISVVGLLSEIGGP